MARPVIGVIGNARLIDNRFPAQIVGENNMRAVAAVDCSVFFNVLCSFCRAAMAAVALASSAAAPLPALAAVNASAARLTPDFAVSSTLVICFVSSWTFPASVAADGPPGFTSSGKRYFPAIDDSSATTIAVMPRASWFASRM